MSTTLKEKLIEKITATEDEDLLQLLMADLNYFSSGTREDEMLSGEDWTELKNMAKEPFGHDTELFEDFKKALEKWRTP